MTILVVDDSYTMRMLLRRDLRMAGWDAVTDVPDGRAALDALSTADVELVLADWNMPDLGGLELIEEMRRRGVDAKVGFVTCEASPQLKSQALQAGAEFLLTKPATPDALDWHVRQALGFTVPSTAPAVRGAERTLQEVLSGLFQRDVAVSLAPPPDPKNPRAVAWYRTERSEEPACVAVADLALAASFGCALARVPARRAEEWTAAHVLTGAVEESFTEVANVMTIFVSTDERHVFQGVTYLGEGAPVDRQAGPYSWRSSWTIDVEGYRPGALGIGSICS